MSTKTLEKKGVEPLSLKEFADQHQESDLGTPWQLENPWTLEVNLKNGEDVFSKMGAMIAYYGDLKFTRSFANANLGKLVKKFFSGESGAMMKVEGNGKVYLADSSKHISLIKINNETLYLNGHDILAFDTKITWDIELAKNLSGLATTGLWSLKLEGTGNIAFTCHGHPLVLKVTANNPVYTDPNATVAWTGGLKRSIKKDLNWQTFIGRTSGETFQVKFEGDGFVVVQPHEEIYVASA